MKKGHSPYNLALMVMNGPAQGQQVVLDRPILLGRDPRSRVPFDDERVSRHHAYIEQSEHKIMVRDLGSKNGTFLNGRELIEPVELKPDDQLRLGKTLLLVSVVDVEGMCHVDTAEFDPNTDPPQLIPDTDKHLPEVQINRLALRRATELTRRLAALGKTRHPVWAIVSAIRKEFRADGAGIFPVGLQAPPLYVEGEIEIPNGTREELCGLGERVNWLTSQLAGTSTLLCFPLRIGESAEYLFLLRRDQSRPFYDDHVQLTDALVECMHILPLREIMRDGLNRQMSDHLASMIGSSEAMTKLREQIASFAATNVTVLIQGESGTGKELCARAISQLSERRYAPHVEMNCACIMPELMEAELFGHEKGAFTGAMDQHLGKLEIADGGTLFLDEIGEMPLALQAKLLRVLEGQPFYRVGGNQLIETDVRFICATNRDLKAMVEQGTFRADLYHRINILQLVVPPFRERLEDLPELVETFMEEFAAEVTGNMSFSITPKAYRRLLSHHWPGNIRELRNVLQRVMLLSSTGVIDGDDIPPEIGGTHESTTMQLPRLQMLTEMIEREEITRALVECSGQKSAAARRLGISRPTLDKKIRLYSLGNLTHRTRDGSASEAS
ncbi:MAG: sigma 54-interacting transcriptional regulator [Candidatus Sumerlaeia bacterium]|nr:sigma 54-interacting transcriptional regulator [Candidatus Sumerlaeia bacterium]